MGDHIQADVLAVCGEHADDALHQAASAHVNEEVLLARGEPRSLER